MINDHERSLISIVMAAAGGSMVAMGLMPWKAMSWAERIIAFIGGIACGIYGAPLVAKWANVSMADLSEKCGIVFFGAAFGLVLMPRIQKRLAKEIDRFGGEEKA